MADSLDQVSQSCIGHCQEFAVEDIQPNQPSLVSLTSPFHETDHAFSLHCLSFASAAPLGNAASLLPLSCCLSLLGQKEFVTFSMFSESLLGDFESIIQLWWQPLVQQIFKQTDNRQGRAALCCVPT